MFVKVAVFSSAEAPHVRLHAGRPRLDPAQPTHRDRRALSAALLPGADRSRPADRRRPSQTSPARSARTPKSSTTTSPSSATTAHRDTCRWPSKPTAGSCGAICLCPVQRQRHPPRVREPGNPARWTLESPATAIRTSGASGSRPGRPVGRRGPPHRRRTGRIKAALAQCSAGRIGVVAKTRRAASCLRTGIGTDEECQPTHGAREG